MKRITPEKLAELKAKNLPHMDASDLGASPKEGCDAEGLAQAQATIEKLNEYLKAFVRVPDGKCIVCGSQLGAKDIVDSFLSNAMFRWGIAHGEGFCGKCGWPSRAIHRIDNDAIQLNMIFQYHPDGIEIKEEVEA